MVHSFLGCQSFPALFIFSAELTHDTHSLENKLNSRFCIGVCGLYKHLAQEDVAHAMRQNMPATLLALFEEKDYHGSGLLGLPTSKGIKTPTASEVSLNYIFLLPVVQAYPSKVGLIPVGSIMTRCCFVMIHRVCRQWQPTCT